MTDYLTVADILATHQDLIERYGGTDGLSDLGSLKRPSSDLNPATTRT